MALAGFALAHALPNSDSTPACHGSDVHLVLSPGSEGALVDVLDSAKTSIDVGLYEFSAAPLKAALIRAKKRGVSIRVLLDSRVDQNAVSAESLALEGIQVKWAPGKYNYFHEKTAAIDGTTLLVGSINWSNSALHNNREADVIVNCPDLAKEWLASFERDWKDGFPVTWKTSRTASR